MKQPLLKREHKSNWRVVGTLAAVMLLACGLAIVAFRYETLEPEEPIGEGRIGTHLIMEEPPVATSLEVHRIAGAPLPPELEPHVRAAAAAVHHAHQNGFTNSNLVVHSEGGILSAKTKHKVVDDSNDSLDEMFAKRKMEDKSVEKQQDDESESVDSMKDSLDEMFAQKKKDYKKFVKHQKESAPTQPKLQGEDEFQHTHVTFAKGEEPTDPVLRAHIHAAAVAVHHHVHNGLKDMNVHSKHENGHGYHRVEPIVHAPEPETEPPLKQLDNVPTEKDTENLKMLENTIKTEPESEPVEPVKQQDSLDNLLSKEPEKSHHSFHDDVQTLDGTFDNIASQITSSGDDGKQLHQSVAAAAVHAILPDTDQSHHTISSHREGNVIHHVVTPHQLEEGIAGDSFHKQIEKDMEFLNSDSDSVPMFTHSESQVGREVREESP